MFYTEVMYWSRLRPQGPRFFGAVKENGIVTMLDLDSSTWHQSLNSILESEVVGFIVLIPAYNQWQFRFAGPRGAVTKGGYKTAEIATEALLSEREQVFREEEEIQKDPVALAKRELACHDWTYIMSDDYRVFRAGDNHWNFIKTLLVKLPIDKARELWLQFAPTNFTFPEGLWHV